MKTREINKEVLYADEPIVKVKQEDIERLKIGLKKCGGTRVRLCAHRTIEDEVHEMLIIHARDAYVRPHKHIAKTESIHVIEGSADLIIFNEAGDISESIGMGDYSSGRKFYYRIADPRYHTLFIKSDFIIFHETTKGPFNREDTIFAPWAPETNDEAACRAFIKRLKESGNFYGNK